MRKKNSKIRAKIIITTHINADFDAIGSMLAAQKLYPESVIIFPGTQEKNLRDFFISSVSYLFNMAEISQIDFESIEKIVIVDTKQIQRVTGISSLLYKKNIEIEIYDHHPPLEGDIKGSYEVCRKTGATVTILVSLLQEKGIDISPEEATIMALGIYEDTGSFNYSSTTPEDFLQASYLLSCGASLDTIVNLVNKEIKSEQVAWLNELLNQITCHKINGVDVHISTISSSSYINDLASIVQKVIRMENLDIFFTIALMGNKITIIARNTVPEVDVGKILLKFGGGGHSYAASAKVENQTLAQVEIKIVELLEKEIQSIKITSKLMSSPAITIKSNLHCKNAAQKMTRYNINSLVVIDKDTKMIQGIVTRQVIEKALYHKLSFQPVTDYMNSEIGFVSPDADIIEIEKKIIEGKQRVLPVIDKNLITGVITRTDFLNYLVQHNKGINKDSFTENIRKNAKIRHIKNILVQRLDKERLALLESIGAIGHNIGFNMFVVGGFVRDLLLNRDVDDIDIVVEGDGIKFAKEFAKINNCRVNTYKKFGTAVIIFSEKYKIDVASARLEYYKTPAALPIVEKSSIKLDLARRDFTINTLAVNINPENFGTLIDFFGANRDIKDKIIRTIHNLSFVEDPTRIFRAIKFANRFDFKIGKVTSNLIDNAVKIDSFKNLSGLRVLSEIKQILEEDNPIPAIKTLQQYNLDKVIHIELKLNNKTYDTLEAVNKTLAWHDLLYSEDKYFRWAVYFMAILEQCTYKVSQQICDKLKLPLRELIIVQEKRLKAQKCLNYLENSSSLKNSQLYWALINFKTEHILYMMSLAKKEKTKKRLSFFYTHLRDKKNYIMGKDLMKIGLDPGPVFSDILKEVLNEKLDGKIENKKEELNFAASLAKKHKLID